MKFLMTSLAWAALGVILAGCGAKASDQVVQVAADDPAMEAAKEKGKRTLGEFDAAYAAHNGSNHAVKFDLDAGDGAEFIWGNVEAIGSDSYSVAIAGEPELNGFSSGQKVVAKRSDVIDWQYMVDGVAKGHHTTRVLIDGMKPEDAAEYRKALGWS